MVLNNSGDRIVEIGSGVIEVDWEVVYRTNGDQFWIVPLAHEAGYYSPRESQTTRFAVRPRNRIVVDKSLIRPNVFHDGLIARFLLASARFLRLIANCLASCCKTVSFGTVNILRTA